MNTGKAFAKAFAAAKGAYAVHIFIKGLRSNALAVHRTDPFLQTENIIQCQRQMRVK